MLNRFIRYSQQYKGWFGGAAAICIFLGLYTGLLASPPDYYQADHLLGVRLELPLAPKTQFQGEFISSLTPNFGP